MADTEIVILGDASSAVRATKQAETAFDSLYLVVRNNWWGIQNIGTAFSALGASIAAGMGASVKAAGDFQTGMAGVARTTRQANETSAEAIQNVGALGQELRNLALTRPVDLERITGIAEQAGALGVARQDVAEFTKTIVDLVNTTDLTDEAATELARIAGVLNIPASQFSNLGSAILEAGRSTASTESEIVNMMKRLASTGKIANMTAGELTAVAAASLSLGSRSEAGASAIQRSVGDMAQAIAQNGDDLKNWAKIAGVSEQQFADAFRKDGFQALTLFIEGIHRLGNDSVAVNQALGAVGITEVRQVKALQELASGYDNTSNRMLHLRVAGAQLNKAYAENTALAQAAAAYNSTFNAQLQIMKNTVRDAGISFGQVLMPAIAPIVGIIADFAMGLSALPAPLKYTIVGLGLAAGATAALAGAFIMLVPRVVLAIDSYRKLMEVARGTTAAEEEQVAADEALVESKGAVAVAAGEAAAALEAAAAGAGEEAAVAGAAAGANEALAVSNAAVAATAGEAAVMEEAAGAGGIVAAEGATAAAVASEGAAAGFTIMGFSAARAGTLIKAALLSPIGKAITLFAVLGGAIAIFGHHQRENLDTGNATNESLKQLNAAMKDATSGVGDFGDGEQKATDDTKKLNDAINEQAQAANELGDKIFAVREAQLAAADAETALQEARRAAKSNAEEVAAAELSLEQAELNHEKAVRDLADAEKKLRRARAQAQRDEAKAERDLADARQNYRDSLDKVAEAQAALNKLQEGPSADELRDATNKLADAQLRLVGAQQKASDAQWYLNYLMEEGASNRDIENAQYQLAQAQQDVADQTDNVIDSQKEYNDLITVTPEERQQAEEALAQALRDSADAADQVKDAELKLKDARDAVANDTAYKEALADVKNAQIALKQSTIDVADAQQKLTEARKGVGVQRDLKKATLAYDEALLNLAKAQADEEIAQRRANGEHIGAAKAAQILANHIGGVAGQMSGPGQSAMGRYSAALRHVRDTIDDTKNALSGLGKMGKGNLDFSKLFKGLNKSLNPAGKKAAPGFIDGMIAYFKSLDTVRKIAVALLLTLVAVFAMVVLGVGPGIALLIAGIVAAIIYWIVKHKDDIKNAFVKMFDAVKGVVEDVIGWVRDHWPLLLAILTGPFGLAILWLHNHWDEVTAKLRKPYDWIKEHWRDVLGWVTSPFSSAVGWVRDHWGTVTDNLKKPWQWIKDRWSDVKGWITSPFSNAVGWIKDHFNSLIDWFRNLPSRLGAGASRMFNWIYAFFKGPLRSVQGMWNNLWEWLGNMSFGWDAKKVLGHTVLPGFHMDFGFLKNLEVHIPGLASGGIVTAPTLAMIGEAGAEAVMPLGPLLAAFKAIDEVSAQIRQLDADLMAAFGAGAGGGGNTYNLTVEAHTDASPKELADELVWTAMVRM